LETSSLYQSESQACLIGLSLKKILDADFRSEWNSCGHFINTSIIIRLHSYLKQIKINDIELFNYVKGEDKKVLDLIYELRHFCAHSNFSQKDSEDDKYYKIKEQMKESLKLPENRFNNSIPLSIDSVLIPLFDKVIEIVVKYL